MSTGKTIWINFADFFDSFESVFQNQKLKKMLWLKLGEGLVMHSA